MKKNPEYEDAKTAQRIMNAHKADQEAARTDCFEVQMSELDVKTGLRESLDNVFEDYVAGKSDITELRSFLADADVCQLNHPSYEELEMYTDIVSNLNFMKEEGVGYNPVWIDDVF